MTRQSFGCERTRHGHDHEQSERSERLGELHRDADWVRRDVYGRHERDVHRVGIRTESFYRLDWRLVRLGDFDHLHGQFGE